MRMTANESRRLTPSEPTPGTSGPDLTAFAKWIDERIDSKLRGERRFNRSVMAELIAQLIAKEKKSAKRSNSKRGVQARQGSK
jgi:hypothetical protein